ncbi:alpha-ketoglutarate-dependent dioxygenase AlkB [Mesorhizobium sp. CGMCC 1.15528]|uniref:Alpha-ketoglutarate-dependent dioxygenase AlkB n=1 Tax=Mesorhizobium zhangyense TaxID=1776730 RepID=A0A7C9R7K2_9HYPH|nr:alpha-ketoglutarate-dependent dioxygenase AlkB [Mesorhizobium zhangyense]NGN42120.1 alpha-ketoglutarate-dependent dioxygenase AlkB [Mesorhizobium zhangyense]
MFERFPPERCYLPFFISQEEEQTLIDCLDRGEWSSELKRRVQHFGYRYDYRARMVTDDAYLGKPPEWLRSLSERLTELNAYNDVPDQIIANEYVPGQGISAHVDCVPCFSERIASLSLLSSCEMIFRNVKSRETISLMLEPRSLLIMSGAARYEWTHEIPSRKTDTVAGEKRQRERRVSLTFRKVVRAV